MTHFGTWHRAIRTAICTLIWGGFAGPVAALDLAWPDSATRVDRTTSSAGAFPIASGPFDGARVPTRSAGGNLSEEVWHIPGTFAEPALLVDILGDQLTAQGYEIDFTCADRACGGFDFRYALPIATAPDMHVDLGNFIYLSATRGAGDGADRIALMLSRGGGLGYAHLAHISPNGTTLDTSVAPAPGVTEPRDMISQLLARGSVPLDDLRFETGASSLSGQRYDSLASLASFLSEDPARQVVLVGHTDAQGSLDANIALSQARADAVRRFLISELGTDPGQVAARGIGYLAPRDSNAEASGRNANRRVEVVLTGL